MLARPASSNRAGNPYTAVLYEQLGKQGVQVSEYSLPKALLGRYDICHVHWPEGSFAGRPALARAWLGAEFLLRGCEALRRRGTKLVWTVHNLRSHEQRFVAAEEHFWRRFVPMVDGFIALGKSGVEAARTRFPPLQDRPAFVIPHHHYRGEYRSDLTRAEARQRLGLDGSTRVILFFGQLREYKNVPALVRAVRALSDAGASLRLLVVGKPSQERLGAELREASAADPRIALHLGPVPSDEVQVFFRACDLVVLPYRDILNSGAAILSLSFDRPVLTPALGACRDLKEEVGPAWVSTYDVLSPEVLTRALGWALGGQRPASCPLDALEPAKVAAQTLAAYAALLG